MLKIIYQDNKKHCLSKINFILCKYSYTFFIQKNTYKICYIQITLDMINTIFIDHYDYDCDYDYDYWICDYDYD